MSYSIGGVRSVENGPVTQGYTVIELEILDSLRQVSTGLHAFALDSVAREFVETPMAAGVSLDVVRVEYSGSTYLALGARHGVDCDVDQLLDDLAAYARSWMSRVSVLDLCKALRMSGSRGQRLLLAQGLP